MVIRHVFPDGALMALGNGEVIGGRGGDAGWWAVPTSDGVVRVSMALTGFKAPLCHCSCVTL